MEDRKTERSSTWRSPPSSGQQQQQQQQLASRADGAAEAGQAEPEVEGRSRQTGELLLPASSLCSGFCSVPVSDAGPPH